MSRNSKKFWSLVKASESMIFHELTKVRKPDEEDPRFGVMMLFEKIGKKTGYPLQYQIGVGLRNGKRLPEREKHIELIISANWNRGNIKLVKELYSAFKNSGMPSYWSVVKFEPFLPVEVESLDLDGITHESFQFASQTTIGDCESFMEVLVFVDKKIADKILIKKDDKNWILRKDVYGQIPLIMLNAVVGEFNMIHTIRAVEFVPSDYNDTIGRSPITTLIQKIDMMRRHDNSIYDWKCNRCGFHSYQVGLSKKGDLFYCSPTCEASEL